MRYAITKMYTVELVEVARPENTIALLVNVIFVLYTNSIVLGEFGWGWN